MQIRKYQASDKKNMQNICLKTSNIKLNDKSRQYLNILYNDYYTEQEPDNCFCLVDDDDKAVGYIICSQDYNMYKQTFTKIYLPKLKKVSLIQYIFKKCEFILCEKYSHNYSAHLHIDILKEYTGSGYGSQLMTALTNSLKEKGINGVMLGVAKDNKKAQNFYLKNGFIVLKSLKFSVFMGKTL